MHWVWLLLLLQFSVFVAAHAAPKQLDRLTILADTDIPGGDYDSSKDRTLQGCRYDCLQDKRCKAYTYNHKAKVCFLKERISKRARFKGATSGVKFTHAMLTSTPDPGPPTKTIIDSWARAEALCLGESKKKRETWAWCNVSETLGVVLELRNWCRGKKGEAGAQMVWHKCEATSLRRKIPKSVSSLGRE
ncbi:MAG: PAN/Apple domain-containing protein [Hyphomicrobiaceae bacterium]|nr:PAN/Apple domain-containing protein [Hyphomicrobiaceae bacterium]